MKVKSIITAILVACSLFIALPVEAGDKININTATVSELQSVKGIGPKTATSIVAYRDKHGTFNSVDDLEEVKGIGEKSLMKFKGELTVNNQAKND
ncbi:MAG TPA: helix-hairpin-helix domain-containing protein [Mariprofundaceae bacterium]|nr:helix-hairpin-helix domain-containing protein [Mariprofundaceae bacterium]